MERKKPTREGGAVRRIARVYFRSENAFTLGVIIFDVRAEAAL